MKNKIAWAGLWLAFTFIFTGCKTAPTPFQLGGVALAAQVVSSGVATFRPQYLPALQTAAADICAFSSSTNNQAPAVLNAALYNLGVGGKFGTIIEGNVDAAFALIQQAMLANTNSANAQALAGAICTGLNTGLALAKSK
jgi:hypothetical protein